MSLGDLINAFVTILSCSYEMEIFCLDIIIQKTVATVVLVVLCIRRPIHNIRSTLTFYTVECYPHTHIIRTHTTYNRTHPNTTHRNCMSFSRSNSLWMNHRWLLTDLFPNKLKRFRFFRSYGEQFFCCSCSLFQHYIHSFVHSYMYAVVVYFLFPCVFPLLLLLCVWVCVWQHGKWKWWTLPFLIDSDIIFVL